MSGRVMTDAEVADARAHLAALRASGDREDGIIAILCDVEIGDSGLAEPVARAKAAAILAWVGR